MSGDTASGEAEARGREPPDSATLVRTVFVREVTTVLLRPSYALLLTVMTLVVLGLAWSGGGIHGGYVPTVVDLLTPLELLVPIVAVALGYRAIRNDERRGELDVLETYPLSAWHLLAGVYLGRALGTVLVVAVPLVLVMLPIAAVGGPVPLVYETHSGADSPWLYLRFVVLTVAFALVLLAVTVAVSTLVTTTRAAIAAATLTLVVLLIGLDIALAYGFASGFVGESNLIHSLAVSPLSAYRGLVLETAVAIASGTGPRTASPVASLASFLLWGIGSLLLATRTLR